MNWIILAAGTILIMLFSWFLSLRYRRYHGIPRFLAFESVFILLLLNIRIWFRDPFSPVHIASWLLLIFSIYPAVAGYILLKKRGQPGRNFENTSRIVKSGIYRYIRHPLYLSIFMFGSGVMLKSPGTFQLILGGIIVVAIWFTARVEEKEMIRKFGAEYEDYMKETRMFIPFVI
jgi:protein-S-isoprenylcysteine O-methyltransferase Ste14